MDAIVTAGGNPQPGEPLYEYTLGKSKALLEVAGRPMIQWVLDALDGASAIDHVVIVGLPDDSQIQSKKLAAMVPNQGSMIDNVRAGVRAVLEINPQSHYVAYVSSDIPTIHSEMVNWVVNTAEQTQHDIYYNVVTRDVMEKRFPGSRRSYVHLRGMEVCGGDLNVLTAQTAVGNDELWNRLVESRKSALKQAALVGYDTLLLLLLRILSLEGVAQTASKRLGIRARAMVCPYAEIAMDVDKPNQLELVRADMERMQQVA